MDGLFQRIKESSGRAYFIIWNIIIGIWVYVGFGIQYFRQPIELVKREGIVMSSFDGLYWTERNGAIVLAYKESNSHYNILEGDKLLKIDHLRVYNLESVYERYKTMPPNSVLLYQVQSPSRNNELFSVLVRTYPRKLFQTYDYLNNGLSKLWNLGIVVSSVLWMLLVYPFVSFERRSLFYLWVSIFHLVLGMIFLLFNYEPFIYNESNELIFSFVGSSSIVAILIAWNIFLLSSRLKTKWGWIEFCLGIIIFSLVGYQVLWQKDLVSYYDIIVWGLCGIGLLNMMYWTWRDFVHKKAKYAWILGATAGLGLGAVYAGHSHVFFLYLVLWNVLGSLHYLRIGKVNLAVQQFIFIVLIGGVFVTTYIIAGEISKHLPFGVQDSFQVLISLGMSIVAGFVMLKIRGYFKQFVLSSFESRSRKIQEFQIKMSQYFDSQELITDFQKEMQSFLSDAPIECYFSTTGEVKNHHQQIRAEIPHNQYWARSKALLRYPIHLSVHSQKYLDEMQWEFVFSMNMSSDYWGLIFIGPKKVGNYNLEETELIHRTVIQLSLILSVIHWIEKEKFLAQKTLEANLTALRSQINPHFLFNALNTISSLIHDNPDGAEEAVEDLAFIFRYTLKTSSEQFARLKDEIELVKHYLRIEQLRFGKRLTVEWDITENCMDVQVPSLIIQTIVENCIKHGISKLTHAGKIVIRSRLEENYMECSIYDNGPGIQLDRIEKGTGLKNSISRLQHIYHTKEVISFENSGDGTLVTLRIPLKIS